MTTSRRHGRARLGCVWLVLALASPACGSAPDAAVAGHAQQSVPEAACRPGDRTETGLQGQTTLEERSSGASERAYTCNLELVGQFEGEGASWQLAWFDDCGYFGTANSSQQQHRGTVAVDASDPRDPQATDYLDAPAMLDPWESLRVNERRRLLAGSGRESFAFYDVTDCAHPRRLSVLDAPDHTGHGGAFAPDGLTYYATNGLSGWTAVDVSDPSRPREIFRWAPTEGLFHSHDVSISGDGTRMYVGQPGIPLAGSMSGPNGLVILDISDIQLRRPDPQVRVVSSLFWRDGTTAQGPTQLTVGGRPYLVFTDELGPGFLGPWGPIAACAQGVPTFGMPRIIDIADERNPRVVSRLGLEVHDPANCGRVVWDNFGTSVFGYDSHYCSADDPDDTTLVACSYFGAGVRVFDVRDPQRPREVAYYKPPARRREARAGSSFYQLNSTGDRTTDWASSSVRFVRSGDEHHLWFTSHDNGLQILRFTNLPPTTGEAS